MRSLEYWEKPGGTLPPRQTALLKLSADPVAIGRDEAVPEYAYRGM